MVKNEIDNKIFVTILPIRKNSNGADLDSIHKEIKKSLDFEDVTKEFLDDRVHMLINDGKIINKLNWNADSYYVNSELVDLETPNILNSSQSALGANKTPQLQGVTLTPIIHISIFSEDPPTLNVHETPVISKSAYLSCTPNSTKSQNLNKHQKNKYSLKLKIYM